MKYIKAYITKSVDSIYLIHSSNGQFITVTAQDLRDITDWALQHMQELEREARAAQEEEQEEK
jgi:hypothetical protein